MKTAKKQIDSPEEILHLFDRKKMDKEWSFVGYKSKRIMFELIELVKTKKPWRNNYGR